VRRRLFILASALSLLFCIVTSVLWIRSFWRADEVRSWLAGEMNFVAYSDGGTLTVNVTRLVNVHVEHFGLEYRAFTRDGAGKYDHVRFQPYQSYYSDYPSMWGYQTGYSQPTKPYRYQTWHLMLYDWMVLSLLLILPTFAFVRHLPKRLSLNLCTNCRYNLTGNTSGTCPECGSPVPSSAATPETQSPRPA